MKRARQRVVVSWDKAKKFWRIGLGATVTKADAVFLGRQLCRRLWKVGRLAQLVVKNKNGRIAFENTYGKDPRRSPG